MLTCLLVLLTATPSSAATHRPGAPVAVVPPDPGLYGYWSAAWWQWAFSQQAGRSALDDETGARCHVKQRGPVWFLAGTTGGSADRFCVVPRNRAILFPIISTVYLETEEDEDDEARAAIAEFFEAVTVREASVNGRELNTDRFGFTSPFFRLRVVEGNVFGVPAGTYRSLAGGYWIMLRPPPPGLHTIHFLGKASFPDGSEFETEVNYRILIR